MKLQKFGSAPLFQGSREIKVDGPKRHPVQHFRTYDVPIPVTDKK